MSKVRKVVIPAAGLGTRFLPTTKAIAKEMLPIVDKPTIQFIIEKAIENPKHIPDNIEVNVTLGNIFIYTSETV